MNRISAVIITLNEEKNIERCLQSLQGIADEIIVVDSFSTDATEAICQSYGVKFIQQKWLGYGEQKNFANELAQFEYILSLDADETLSDELKASILAVKSQTMSDAYYAHRRTNYCGTWIYHCGWYPDAKIRLWRKGLACWTTPKVHETIKLADGAELQPLSGDILHYSYYTLDEHVQVANKYTSLAAKEYFLQGRKANFIKLYFNPTFSFIRNYFLRLGIMDGYNGFVICAVSGFSTFLKYAKLKQLWQQYLAAHEIKTSLIISTYNRPDALELVLQSVLSQSVLPYEVIVADDGSREETRALIERYQANFPVPLHHCWQDDNGFRLAKIRNLAIGQSKGNYIVMVDGDMVLHRHFIRDHQHISLPNQFIQGRRVILTEKETKSALAEKRTVFNLLSSGVHNKINALSCPLVSNMASELFSKHDHNSVRGCNMAFWRDDVISVNGFNEGFVGWGREDSEFVVRLLNFGVKRKDLRLGGVAYHLYHPEHSKSELLDNDQRLNYAIEHKLVTCEQGIAPYLK